MPTLTKVKADLAQPGIPARYQEKGVFAVVSTYEASALAADTVIEMCKIQAGVTVLGGQLVCDALGASTTLAVGTVSTNVDPDDTFDADFLAASNVGTSAQAFTILSAGKFPKTFATDDTLDVQIAGGTGDGTITLIAYMTAEEVDLV